MGNIKFIRPHFIYCKENNLWNNDGTEPFSYDKCIIAREKRAIKVGSNKIPMMVPIVEAPIRNLNCVATKSCALRLGAVSIKLPVKGCCIIFASLEIITIILKRDKADAIIFTLAPDNLTA